VAVPVIAFAFRRVVTERMGVVVLSVIVAHEAWHWMTERGSEFLAYDIVWPTLDAAFAVTLMRWAMLALIIGGAAWLLRRPFSHWIEKAEPRTGAAEPQAP